MINIKLKPFNEHNITELCDWFSSNDEVLQWGGPGIKWPLSRSQILPMLHEGWEKPPRRWMFRGLNNNTGVAHAQVSLDWDNGVALLGRVVVNPYYRGKKIAFYFLRSIIGEVFSIQDFERLELYVYSFNQPAIKTYQRLGFIEEGIKRSVIKSTNGRWSEIIFSMLRSEFIENNKEQH